jgi:hypothetical protein
VFDCGIVSSVTARHTPESIAATLAARSIRQEQGCLLWQGSLDNGGYGTIQIAGKVIKTHRAAWEAAYGPVPPGLKVCHRCDVRSCIEPTHLWLGTQRENMQDAGAKGRMSGRPWNAGRPWDEATKAKIAATSRLRQGKLHTAESKAKMAEARRAWWRNRLPT